MKKFLMTLLVSLAVSASCFAAGAAKNFAVEEKAADELVSSLIGDTVKYEQVSKYFSEGLKKNLTAANFANLKKQIKTQVGGVKDVNFVTYVKQYAPQSGYNNVEELLYIGTVNKDKFARFAIVFTVEKNVPKVNSFQVVPVEVAKKPEAKKK